MDRWSELTARIDAVENPWIATLLRTIVSSREHQMRTWPAAQTVHHAYEGGLLEHILKVAQTADALAQAYEADRDLVFAGAVLHDIGKLEELTAASAPGYTRDGNLLGHITLGVVIVREATSRLPDFPPDLRARLEHMIVSHHGSRQMGSPVEPMTVEAFILSAADDLDARIYQVRQHLAEDVGEGEFTAFHPRLRRILLKPSDR
ncbi:MAG TPA: HD domain-containing protein [Vicinamibacterales bacterium]|jgi:3'-5' exoribonuclease